MVRPEGMGAALGICRALSRIETDAARAETGFLCVFDACYEYLMK